MHQSRASFSSSDRDLNLTPRGSVLLSKDSSESVRLWTARGSGALRLWTHPTPRSLPQKKLAWIDRCYRLQQGFLFSAQTPDPKSPWRNWVEWWTLEIGRWQYGWLKYSMGSRDTSPCGGLMDSEGNHCNRLSRLNSSGGGKSPWLSVGPGQRDTARGRQLRVSEWVKLYELRKV